MIDAALADLVLVGHFAFVLFVILGGVLVLRWPRLAWIHVPMALWGVLVEFGGFVCPLTALENYFRRLGGQAGYPGGCIDHYVTAVLYPAGLTRATQWLLGTLLLAGNALIYWRLAARRRTRHDRSGGKRNPIRRK
jgi:Protein of Unknown function (DUF2784)